MGEIAQLITAIGGALGVVLTPVVTLLIARGPKPEDEAQNKRIAELERLLAERDQPKNQRRKGDE